MKDIELMINFIENLSCLIYGKEVFLYSFDDNKWYSRDYCRYVNFEEVITWLKDRVYPEFYED